MVYYVHSMDPKRNINIGRRHTRDPEPRTRQTRPSRPLSKTYPTRLCRETGRSATTATFAIRVENIAVQSILQQAAGARVDQLDHLACCSQILDKLRQRGTRVSKGLVGLRVAKCVVAHLICGVDAELGQVGEACRCKVCDASEDHARQVAWSFLHRPRHLPAAIHRPRHRVRCSGPKLPARIVISVGAPASACTAILGFNSLFFSFHRLSRLYA